MHVDMYVQIKFMYTHMQAVSRWLLLKQRHTNDSFLGVTLDDPIGIFLKI